MSDENVEITREGYAEMVAGRPMTVDRATPDFAWDMTHFSGWPEQPVYDGVEGMAAFLADWAGAWDGWKLELLELHDAGEKVVAVVHQHARSKLTGMPLDMSFAQVWTYRDGLCARMDMFSDVDEAKRSAGLA